MITNVEFSGLHQALLDAQTALSDGSSHEIGQPLLAPWTRRASANELPSFVRVY
ncbi:predicted protein [Plenodomus lingam JN3]|uniref:Predicted protein n=1 Tax=Leptosphaeria maculans (strain JN3 / isolate v23.1.3 / race Av1-4-5-6-7-8) TaxID=985895 RepID=E4ZJP2_LEPMJ|nr:predicted protein [Plenodomus lingam JN3]CBX91327.1 predicted protein [Plenodomus lingam JN3]